MLCFRRLVVMDTQPQDLSQQADAEQKTVKEPLRPIASGDLRAYYRKYFPVEQFYNWLAYTNGANYFFRREICFTLEGSVYIRFLNFMSHGDLREKLMDKTPVKIDIGAVYSRPFLNRAPAGAVPIERELTFDIDMTDYDDVRLCCKGAKICPKCWPLMQIAAQILDESLRDDFGFQHRLWLFSGRRGIHCWVCDEKVRKLAPPARRAIVDYLTVAKGGEHVVKKVRLGFNEVNHVHIKRAIKYIEPYFENKFVGALLKDESGIKRLIALLPDGVDRNQFQAKLVEALNNDEDVWAQFKALIATDKLRLKLSSLPAELMLHFCYPRLDANVTTQINHLLKSPFSVHPDTGKISVPIHPSALATFDPEVVPSLHQLHAEMDNALKNNTKLLYEDQSQAWKHTSLAPYVEVFERFIAQCSPQPPAPVQPPKSSSEIIGNVEEEMNE